MLNSMEDIQKKTAELQKLLEQPTTKLKKAIVIEDDDEELTRVCEHCGNVCSDLDDIFCSASCEELARYDAYGDEDY